MSNQNEEHFETSVSAEDAALQAELAGGSPPRQLKEKPRPKIQQPKQAPPTDRLPPHSEEMERGVLACILNDPKRLDEAVERIKGDPLVFYDLRHQLIYSEFIRMADDKTPIEFITLQQRLKDAGKLEQIGGLSYLNQIQDSSPSSANLSYYTEIVVEKALRRRLISSCSEVIGKAFDGGDVNTLITDVEKVLTLQNDQSIINILDGKSSGLAMVNDLENRNALEGKLSGLDTGLINLNYMTEGLQSGEQFVIGARPSQGKTALGLSVFKHCAFNGIPSLFVSLEMSVESIMRRLLAMHMSIPLRTIRRGSYGEIEFQKFVTFQSLCLRHPMHIVDGVRGIGIRELCSIIRRRVIQSGVRLVVVDYLQKIRPAERHEKRTYEIGDISGRLKALAVECNVALVTLAQLNRENTKDKGRAPRLSDLADSGQIERDADTVGLLHKKGDGIQLIIAKQRDGETGGVALVFDGDYVRFENPGD